jgi:hypothetical protein
MRFDDMKKLTMVKLMNKLIPIIRSSKPKASGGKYIYSASTTIKNDSDVYKFYLDMRKVAYLVDGLVKREGKFEKVIVDRRHSAYKEICKTFAFGIGQKLDDPRNPCVFILKTVSNEERHRRKEYLEDLLYGQYRTEDREVSSSALKELEELQEGRPESVTITLNFAVDSIVPKRRSASEAGTQRLASDVLRDLEVRVAKLEREASPSFF